jgi:hypothetical protein
LGQSLREILDGVAYAEEGLGLLVGNLDAEFVVREVFGFRCSSAVLDG